MLSTVPHSQASRPQALQDLQVPIISDIQKTRSGFPVNLPTVQCVMAICAKYLPTDFSEEALFFSSNLQQ